MSAPQILERIKQHLVKLKFVSALEVLDQTVQRLEKNEISALEALDELLEQEHGFRETRRVRTQLRTSRLLQHKTCLLYTSPSPRDRQKSRMPSSA